MHSKTQEQQVKSTRPMPMPIGPFERFVESMEKDTLPPMDEFFGWLREEMKKAPEAPAEPAAPAAPVK